MTHHPPHQLSNNLGQTQMLSGASKVAYGGDWQRIEYRIEVK